MPRLRMYDRWLFFATGLLLVAGLFMVGSASQYQAMGLGNEGTYFLVRHAVFCLVGVGVMLLTMSFPYGKLDDARVIRVLLAVTFVALIAVLATSPIGGARRWFRFGPVSLQPAEFAKLTTIVAMAWLLSRRESEVNEPKRVLVPAAVALAPALVLINMQPDLGSGVMIALVAGVMVFVAGLRWSWIGIAGGVATAAAALAVIAQPYRLRRIFVFLDRDSDLQGAGFQLHQSLLALGSGGVLGVGFGQGQQKAYFLPAPHTDFIYSVIGEELGFVGAAAVLATVLVLFWRGMRAARRAPDRFAFYLALGCTTLIVFQSLVHMGVCVGLLPTKGLPLPFVSYGGSSLLAMTAAAGWLINVSQHSN